MSLQLGAPLGVSSLQGSKLHMQGPAPAASSSRARPRVTCQATFGAPKPASQRVREQSPSKVQALAAPAAERALDLPSSPPPQRAATSNILEVHRAGLERLLQREAAAPVHEDMDQREQRQQEEQQQQQEQQPEAALPGRQQQPPAASSAPTGLQRSVQQSRRSRVIPSTRQSRTVAAAAAAAPAAPRPRQSGGSRDAAALAAEARETAATTATLTSWLIDCRSRRERGAKQPLAVFPTRRKPPTAACSPARSSSSSAAPVLLDVTSLEGLSDETKQDMLLLIKARSALKVGRRPRRRLTRSSTAPDGMTSLLRGLGHTAILSRPQEAALAGVLQKGIALKTLAEKLAQQQGCEVGAVSDAALAAAAGLPSAADVRQRLANQVEAKDLLMQYNTRLVINIAKRYTNNGLELADLIPEGMRGLSKSLDRFEPSKGFKFSTYAHWWIRQAISRAVCDQGRTVRLPSHVCENLFRINRAIYTLSEQCEGDEMPSYEAIAAEVGLPVRRVIHFIRISRLPGNTAQRERPAGFLAGSSMKEMQYDRFADLADDDDTMGGIKPDDEISGSESVRHVVDLLLSTLEKRERNILRLRYGLLGWAQAGEEDEEEGGSMSLGEVATAYGLSKERIRQIEDKAMRALRKPWRQQLAQELGYGESLSSGSALDYLAETQHQLAVRDAPWSSVSSRHRTAEAWATTMPCTSEPTTASCGAPQ